MLFSRSAAEDAEPAPPPDVTSKMEAAFDALLLAAVDGGAGGAGCQEAPAASDSAAKGAACVPWAALYTQMVSELGSEEAAKAIIAPFIARAEAALDNLDAAHALWLAKQAGLPEDSTQARAAEDSTDGSNEEICSSHPFDKLWFWGHLTPQPGKLRPTEGGTCWSKAFRRHLYACGAKSMSDEAYEARDFSTKQAIRNHLNEFLNKPMRNVSEGTRSTWEIDYGLPHADIVAAFGAWRTIDNQLPTLVGFGKWKASLKLKTPEDVAGMMESHGHLRQVVHLCWKRWCVMLVDPCKCR
jgi:hypothetical protein